ncbi:MAG: hypothetical protein QMD05_10745 [Candidatus Brocadiaceae bacterium]|nr:hypothetical protein [Candidatus Brocadiaceae bacterium]
MVTRCILVGLLVMTMSAGCAVNKASTVQKGAAIGAVGGAAVGAGAGLLVGAPGLGAAAGSAAGATVGALVGDVIARRDDEKQERVETQKQLSEAQETARR